MTKRKQSKVGKPLTEVELEIMNIVWKFEECTVKDVQNALPKGRDLAYTSVATMMRILEEKNVIGSRKNDRAHVYCPKLTKPEYELTALRHMTNHLFQGDTSSLVMRLLHESELSEEELKSIRSILDERLST